MQDGKQTDDDVAFTPRFNAEGLLPVVVTDAVTDVVLMLAWMNAEALSKTISTGEAWYWSRSRRSLWHKGETSGRAQEVTELRIDCDQDALWLSVRVGGDGRSCHTGRTTCFYRSLASGPAGVHLRQDRPQVDAPDQEIAAEHVGHISPR